MFVFRRSIWSALAGLATAGVLVCVNLLLAARW